MPSDRAAPRKLPPDYEIIKRRAREDAQAVLNDSRRQNELWGNVANWEIKTTNRIVTQSARLKAEKLDETRLEDLLRRRKKLAQLLHDEQVLLEEEYRHSFETPEQRRARLSKRAKMLKQQREDKRKIFAQEALVRQQRLQQDEMRYAQSQLRTIAVTKARGAQLEERRRQKGEQKQREDDFAKEWDENRRSKEVRELEESKIAGTRNREMKEMLDFQVSDTESRRSMARQQLESERSLSRAVWAKEVEDEATVKVERSKQQYVERLSVQEANKLRSRQRDEEKTRECDLDKYLLQMQLEKDAEDQAREDEERMRVKQSAKDFQKHLAALAVKEAKDDSSNEAVRLAEQEKEWKKRQDKWDREAKQRSELMKSVNETRAAQIEEKLKIAARHKVEDAQWTTKAVEESKITDALEEDKARKVRTQKKANQNLIMQQIQDKEMLKRAEKQREYLDDKRAKAYTKRFQADIELMRAESMRTGVVDDNFPKRKSGLW